MTSIAAHPIHNQAASQAAGRLSAVTAAGLAAVTVLGAFLRLYQLGAYSIGNAYYAAAVQSMLLSWRNFFYLAFEPGASVMVDKPPLGLWLQAGTAFFLGVNGFSLALPQALAGVISIPLLYGLVRRPFGRSAGLLAALVLALMPVTIAAERNNTMDGTLLLVLLLAAWAVLQARRQGRLRWLLLGFFLVGLGFNIKMLQAFMVLPALYAVYLLGAPIPVRKRVWHLSLATLLLAGVSLAWVLAVELTPAAERPYVGGSAGNSMLELVIGHNALDRLEAQGAALSGKAEVGRAGLLRLFTPPLSDEASWLLPLALLGLPLAAWQAGRSWPLKEEHWSLVLWGGWLLPMLAYFSFTPGLWHTYYLIMLGPAVAALTAAAAWALGQIFQRRRWLGWMLASLLTGGTLLFQIGILAGLPGSAVWMAFLPAAAWLAGAGLLAGALGRSPRAVRSGVGLLCASLLAAPLAWSLLTALNPHPDVWLPHAGPEPGDLSRPTTLAPDQAVVLDYLLARAQPGSYLAATLNATEAAPYILASGRPLLTFGGFRGRDSVVSLDRLAQMAADGSLRFVLPGRELAQFKPEIAAWLRQRCQVVQVRSQAVYDCGILRR
jgi:4-amino-4-deoxy-L-arabinose transferase-like glycosyltransferase